LAGAALFTAVAQRRLGGSLLTPANALTLSRAGAAAVVAARPGSRAGWAALVMGATLTDWLDGPLARSRGATPLGAVLDLEADSWLTLWSAVAAYRCRSLPAWSLLPPTFRYLMRLVRRRPPRHEPWRRAAGTAQMLVLAGALSPWRRLRGLAARVALPAQVLAFAAEATG
jgi:phosphatidylglycerophosphate synthase